MTVHKGCTLYSGSVFRSLSSVSILDIFRTVGCGGGWGVRCREVATFMVPRNFGRRVRKFVPIPTGRRFRLGRVGGRHRTRLTFGEGTVGGILGIRDTGVGVGPSGAIGME